MRQHTDWKAYRGDELVLHCWTADAVADKMEYDAFRIRLNQGDLTRVEVSPHGHKPYVMVPA